MTGDNNATPPTGTLANTVVVAATASIGIVVALWVSDNHAVLDTPARPSWVALASLVALALALRRAPSGLLLAYVAVSILSILGSLALGSSWAVTTWWPIVIAVVEVARLSPAFILALSAALLLQTAPVLAITQTGFGGTGTSGSTAYFAGFVGAIAAPHWFHRAWATRSTLGGRIMSAVATLVSALALWSAFSSGSRAVALALVLAATGYIAASIVRRSHPPAPLRSLVMAGATVAVLVVGLDYVFGLTFGTGGTIAPVVTGRIEATVVALNEDGPNSGNTRLALWRQAAMAVGARPLGHGPGSYAHVILAYQDAPMLWSASPHNMWALAAVETGIPGLALLLALTAVAARSAWRRSPAAFSALVAATVVMALDVFGSMPIAATAWWAVVGTALSAERSPVQWARLSGTVGLVVVIAIALLLANRLAGPCVDSCEPIVRYGGLPRLVGYPVIIGDDPMDSRWALWSDRYPTASWLRFARAGISNEPEALLNILRAYPYHSAETYIDVADAYAPDTKAMHIAACGLVRFFDGRPIWRDWRSSADELDGLRQALMLRAGTTPATESACVAAGIPVNPIGLK